jgi:hypothetical protein
VHQAVPDRQLEVGRQGLEMVVEIGTGQDCRLGSLVGTYMQRLVSLSMGVEH